MKQAPSLCSFVFYFVFFSEEGEKEEEIAWVGRWRGSGRSWENGKCDQNIEYEKCLNKK